MTDFVGISIMPEYFQVEGRAVFDRLERAGATAIVTSPCVMEPAPRGQGTREPPIKGALLDRPLWGKRELMANIAPSFYHRADLYQSSTYRPPLATELTRRDGHLVPEFLDAARSSGLETHIRIQSAAPPGFRAQFSEVVEADEPRLPDGSRSSNRVDKNGSLASDDIRAYFAALLHDVALEYPEIDGFHVDWAEYPPYSIDAVFFDFSTHAVAAANRLGFDAERMRRDSEQLMRLILTGLTDSDLTRFLDPAGGRHSLLRIVLRFPGFLDLLRFKTMLVIEFLAAGRKALDDAGGSRMGIAPMAFPPPWTLVSGFDYGMIGDSCASIALKLIPSHWTMMLKTYGEAILAGTPGLSEALLVQALGELLSITDGGFTTPLDRIPHGADEGFVPGERAETSKIRTAQHLAGDVPVIPLLHAVGTDAEFAARLQANYRAAGRKVWINRYAFLSDSKIDRIGGAVR